jgi:hypothetical protein
MTKRALEEWVRDLMEAPSWGRCPDQPLFRAVAAVVAVLAALIESGHEHKIDRMDA